MDDKSPTVLSEFWEFAADFKSITAWIAKAAVAAPLVDLVLNIGAPWPSRIAVSILICIAEVIVLMYAFEFWRRPTSKTKTVQLTMRIAMGCFFLILLAYIYLFASYVKENDDAWHRVVVGFTMHSDIAELAKSNPSHYTPKELLLQFHDPEKVWTSSSVDIMRTVVLTVWIALWISLATAISAFVSLQWKRRPKKGKVDLKSGSVVQ